MGLPKGTEEPPHKRSLLEKDYHRKKTAVPLKEAAGRWDGRNGPRGLDGRRTEGTNCQVAGRITCQQGKRKQRHLERTGEGGRKGRSKNAKNLVFSRRIHLGGKKGLGDLHQKKDRYGLGKKKSEKWELKKK